MNSKAGQALLRAAILTLLCGAMSVGLAQDGADDLQAGIEAFNRGDLPGAMTLYEVAAESGLPEAQVRLAFLLDYAEENDKAVHWYRAAADQGYTDGIAGLAGMYAKGEGVDQDFTRARELYEKAGEAGHAGSIRVLITAYDKGGLDVDKDATQAAYWRGKQASLKDSGN
ncbi:MAG TPA: tetratricopeptide repeat protein [Woeseiaceae bacterium]|jgi:TPR repeat protein